MAPFTCGKWKLVNFECYFLIPTKFELSGNVGLFDIYSSLVVKCIFVVNIVLSAILLYCNLVYIV